MQTIKRYLPLLILIGISVLLFLISRQIPAQQIRPYIQQAGYFGPVVWMVITLITYVVAPVSGSPMLFLGFYAFGKMVIVYTLLVGTIGASINFYIAKRFGRSLVRKLAGDAAMQKIDQFADKHGLVSLFFLRALLSNFHDTISYAAGLTSMPFLPYLMITIVGFIPATIIWYIATSATQDPVVFTLISLVISLILFGLYSGGLIVKKWLTDLKSQKIKL